MSNERFRLQELEEQLAASRARTQHALREAIRIASERDAFMVENNKLRKSLDVENAISLSRMRDAQDAINRLRVYEPDYKSTSERSATTILLPGDY